MEIFNCKVKDNYNRQFVIAVLCASSSALLKLLSSETMEKMKSLITREERKETQDKGSADGNKEHREGLMSGTKHRV